MSLSLDFLALPLLAAASLIFFSVLAGVISARAGFSFLLVFLVVGTLAGVDGPGGVRFDDFKLSFWVGNVALAVILLDGGLRTEFTTFRTGLRPALPGLASGAAGGCHRGLYRRGRGVFALEVVGREAQ
jgi:potassium/hydrogen antiporter